MATSKEYLNFILEQLSELDEISYRSMMGEYIIYYKGKVIGGIYDNRFLIKPVKSALNFMKETSYDIPYDGAKQMLIPENIDDKTYLKDLIEAIYDELPNPKPKKKNNN